MIEILLKIKTIEPRYYTVAILCFINLLNYMDRYAVASVLLDIENYFNLRNQAAGLIQTVFVTCYMVCAPFMGYLGDRHDRKVIICLGVAVWCITTLASSFVSRNSFWLFLTLRALVGVGEASYSTVAPTIFADLFPSAEESSLRLTCLSLFYFAIPVGSGLGYILASSLAHATHFWGWGLRVTPFVGAILIITLHRYIHNIPTRPVVGDSVDSVNHRQSNAPSFYTNEVLDTQEGETRQPLLLKSGTPIRFSDPLYGEGYTMIPTGLSTWFRDVCSLLKIPTFTFITFGITWVSFVVGALALWAPTFMQLSGNAHGPPVPVTQEEVGFRFGLVTCGAGALGLIGGNELARRYRPSLGARADPLVCGWALMIGSPLLYAAIYSAKFAAHTSGPWARASSWVTIFLAEIGFCSCWALVVDIILSVVPVGLRSTSQATQMLISHALGDASSAYIVGAVSQAILTSWYPAGGAKGGGEIDFLPTDPSFADRFKSLQYALYITPFVGVLGSHFFLRASRSIERDVVQAKATAGELIPNLGYDSCSISPMARHDSPII